MTFSGLLKKMAEGIPLSELEKQALYLEAQKLEQAESRIGSWSRAGTITPKLTNPIISMPHWAGSALGALFTQRIADTTVTNNTNTYITFDTTNNKGDVWHVEGDKIWWDAVDGQAFDVAGYVTWAANATGYRGAWIEGFDASGASLGASALHTAAGQNLVDNVLPISFKWFYNGFAYIKFYVKQTSGGDLTMKDFLIGLALS